MPAKARTKSPPRLHKKPPAAYTFHGTRKIKETPESVRKLLRKSLGLTFDPSEWQLWALVKIQERYDGIYLASPGSGKSLLIEGTAVLSRNQVVLVISPLKVLEMDQVNQASEKGLRALAMNEDTVDKAKRWHEVKEAAHQVVYMSPEMAKSSQFHDTCKDPEFTKKIAAVFIDEAQCTDVWGRDFRPEYADLGTLRSVIGHSVPFIGLTGTASSHTFAVIWDTLQFGVIPFYGIDMGCRRENLTYIISKLEHPRDPAIHITTLLPSDLSDNTPRAALPKVLLYLETQEDCQKAAQTLRKCLPSHLRNAVYGLASDLDEEDKSVLWQRFLMGDNFYPTTLSTNHNLNSPHTVALRS